MLHNLVCFLILQPTCLTTKMFKFIIISHYYHNILNLIIKLNSSSGLTSIKKMMNNTIFG